MVIQAVRCKARDLYPLTSSRTETREGYLIAPARINRTGIQVYTARELGVDGGDKRIRLYRSPTEVFRAETLKSFEGQPATDDHPPDGVNSTNWSHVAKGDVKDIRADGNYTAAEVIVKDEATKKKVKDGKSELSCGYDFDLVMEPGKTADGEQYDGLQTNIIGNHIAIVDYGRAGSAVRIADREPKGNRTMAKHRIQIADTKVKTSKGEIAVPGVKFDVELDDAVAASVLDGFDRHGNALKELKDAHGAMCDERDFHMSRADGLASQIRDMAKDPGADADEDGDEETADAKKGADAKIVAKIKATLDAKDAEIKRLKALSEPAAIEKLAETRAKAVADARVVIGKVDGKDFDDKGKTIAQIRAAALDAALKNDALKGVAAAVLGGTEPAKADEPTQMKALDAVRAVKPGTTAIDDGQDRDLSRRLLGQDASIAVADFDPMAAYYMREAEMSRKPARGADANLDADGASVTD